ncbi:hypothetical protein ACWDYJ_32155 [Streptomyces sp. NPDC003042]
MRHRYARFTAAAALSASSLLLVSACIPDTGKKADGKPAEVKPSEAKTPAEPKPLTPAEAKTVLVKETDLTAGWKLQAMTVIDGGDASQYSYSKADKPECQRLVDYINTGRLLSDYKVSEQVVFYDRSEKSVMAQDVSGYERPAEVESAVKALADAVKACGSFKVSVDGKPGAGKAEALQIPALGEQSNGLRVRFTQGSNAYDYDVATVRVGANITTYYNNWGDGGERGEKAFDQAIRKAAENLKTATAAAAK